MSQQSPAKAKCEVYFEQFSLVTDTPKISFILPWYKKIDLFKLGLPHNSTMFTVDAEVVIAMDDPEDIGPVMSLIKMLPHIRFVVVMNSVPHEWRPPCRAINVGIRHASGQQIAIMSPETVLRLPEPNYLTSIDSRLFRQTFFTPMLYGIESNGINSRQLTQRLRDYQHAPPLNFGYGFMLCARWQLEAIRGFDESRTRYGGDDNNVRLRLLQFGLQMVVDPNIHACHIDHENRDRKSEFEPWGPEVILNQDFGRSFNNVIWDWKAK